MVWQKRLNFGPTACFVPPCVPKSAKGKRSVRNKIAVCKQVSDEQLCAFDLLATVAGKLLQEGESYAFSDKTTDALVSQNGMDAIKRESLYDERPIEYKASDPVNTLDSQNGDNAIKKEKLYDENPVEFKAFDPVNATHDVIGEPTADTDNTYKDETIDGNINAKSNINSCNSAYKMNMQAKPLALTGSDIIIHSNGGDQIIDNGFLPYFRDEKLLVNRDDDEKFSCTTYSSNHTMNRNLKYQEAGQHRASQHLATKLWNTVTTLTKGREFPTSEMKNMPYFPRRKVCYGRQRSSFMRRKYLPRYNRGVDWEDKRILSTSKNGHLSSYRPEHFNVKLTIKSFEVPEIFFEIPKTSTVGSLKATVMDALNAVLGNALRVGVVFQGKKVRDDNKTLFQAGISNVDKLDDLGFTLEPNTNQTSELLVGHKDSVLQTTEAEPISRFPIGAPSLDSQMIECRAESSQMPTAKFLESDLNSIPSHAEIISQDNKIVETLPVKTEPMHMGLDQKPKQIEIPPRRMRRPFSVTEVEALVHAVEEFGTGRWKDIKIRAFENADHRTYVDLKDKWKTLVHTAEISPQQRRGEPVPQELLDRVLIANAYWTDHAAKLQSRPLTETCISVK